MAHATTERPMRRLSVAFCCMFRSRSSISESASPCCRVGHGLFHVKNAHRVPVGGQGMDKKCILVTGLALAFCSASFSGHSQESGDNLVPIGSFVKVTGEDGEHANGHQIRLWRTGDKLVGKLIYWDFNVEGQRGDFKDGSIDPKTMKMHFQVTVERGDVAPKEYYTALFNGRLRGAFLEGSLKWIGEAAIGRGEHGVEKLKLPKDKKVKLLPFRTTKDWEEAPLDRDETQP